MYIKLIQPRMKPRPMDTEIKLHMAPPLGLLTIASLLKKEHRVEIENENIEKIRFDDQPDLVGISVTVDVYNRACEIASAFMEKGVCVVAGGIHITTAWESIPENRFSALSIGCAEGTWPTILKDFSEGRLKKRYFCAEDFRGEEIVSPDYERIPKRKYLYNNVVHTSRGCPYRCDFCYNSAKRRMYLNRPIEDVVSDIRKIGLKHIMFIDDNFAGNRAWTEAFLKRITPMKIKWNAAVSLDAAKDMHLLDLMKESGCRSLFIGFESINEDSVSAVHKHQNRREDYENAVREIHKRGIMINASFVFGLDADTKETFSRTVDWIVKNKIETVTSHILTPYPGTALYNRMRAEGRILTEDLSLYNTALGVFRPRGMSEKELYDGYLKVYKSVYSLKNIIKRLPEERSQRVTYLLFNLLYRKYGRFTDFLCRRVGYETIGRLAQKIAKYI